MTDQYAPQTGQRFNKPVTAFQALGGETRTRLEDGEPVTELYLNTAKSQTCAWCGSVPELEAVQLEKSGKPMFYYPLVLTCCKGRARHARSKAAENLRRNAGLKKWRDSKGLKEDEVLTEEINADHDTLERLRLLLPTLPESKFVPEANVPMIYETTAPRPSEESRE